MGSSVYSVKVRSGGSETSSSRIAAITPTMRTFGSAVIEQVISRVNSGRFGVGVIVGVSV